MMLLQKKETPSRDGTPDTPKIMKQIAQKPNLSLNKTEIPNRLKHGAESVSEFYFDNVRVHYSPSKPGSVRAFAYTRGNHVYIGPGPERRLSHELGNAVQQEQRKEDFPIQMVSNATFGSAVQVEQAQESPQQEAQEAQEPQRQRVYPIMIYETFGPSENDLLEIYKISCGYPGRTICILGLNRRLLHKTYEANPSFPNIANLSESIRTAMKPNHEAYIIPFYWRAVGDSKIKDWEKSITATYPTDETIQRAFVYVDQIIGYTLPYYEVRGHLMEEASNIVAMMNLPQDKVLFRWIDRDAGQDNSGLLKRKMLVRMARNTNTEVLSGTYDWDPSQRVSNRMARFVTIFNNAERELRQEWFDLNRNKRLKSSYFYMPEPALIMNYAAHSMARNNLGAAANGTLKRQDRESMEALKDLSTQNVRFQSSFSVQKPNKRLPGQDKSYLKELEELMNEQPTKTLEQFSEILTNVRQSAFDNRHWAFIKESKYSAWYRNDTPLDFIKAYKDLEYAKSHFATEDTLKLAQTTLAQMWLNYKRRQLAGRLYDFYKSYPLKDNV